MDYKNLKVNKPWGYEYLAFECKMSATWFLNLTYNEKTSLHCHPKKKTGFVLLDGEVEIDLGFYKKKILKAPDKIMIRPGLFHCTKAISKEGAKILEIESPVDKEDLVRFKDEYGRENSPYEGKNYMEELKNEDLMFEDIEKKNDQTINFLKRKLNLKKILKKDDLLIQDKNSIFAILDKGLYSDDDKLVLSPGDIIRYDTIKKLSSVFHLRKYLTILMIN